jgi:hypothetical protein
MHPKMSQIKNPCLKESDHEIRHFLARAPGSILKRL